MVHSLSFSQEEALGLERIEAAVWGDCFRAASAEEAAACGTHLDTGPAGTMMAASGVDVLAFNRLLGFGVEQPATQAMVDAVVASYAAAGVSRFFIQVSPAARPPQVYDWLAARGFRHHNNWVKLFRRVEDPPQVSTDLHVRPVGPEHAEAFAGIVALAFEWPDRVMPWLARLVGRVGWHHYLAFDGDVPVATGALYVHDGIGYLGPAATLPACRGRGAQGALIARRLRDAAALGCSWLVTETAEDRPGHSAPSMRNMLRYGFEIAYRRPNYLYLLNDPVSSP